MGAPTHEPCRLQHHVLDCSVRSLNILLADDNPNNQRVAQRMLRLAGHQTTLADNGKVALALIARQTFDVVLRDTQLTRKPLCTGWFQCCRRASMRNLNIDLIGCNCESRAAFDNRQQRPGGTGAKSSGLTLSGHRHDRYRPDCGRQLWLGTWLRRPKQSGLHDPGYDQSSWPYQG